ncbi:MAG: LytTR family DNA-binding domain-containing protein [Erythrobacter sp.]
MLFETDPQGQLLWIEMIFKANPSLLEADKPIGLFFSGKASSEAFLNGIALGANGVPGNSQLSEQPGDMDAVFFVPEGVLKAEGNRLVMRMSSMNGEITLQSPIHIAALAPYRDPRKPGAATWFALITFGLFAAAFVFFGVGSLRGKDRAGSGLIAIIALAAALQLAAESARDIFPYPYPLHDLRLSLILTFAIILGLGSAAYVLLLLFRSFPRARLLALSALFLLMMLTSTLLTGFDLKTASVLICASLSIGLAGLIAWANGNHRAAWFAVTGCALSAAIYWLGGFFLDTWLYLVVAAVLLWLFFVRARSGFSVEPSGDTAGQERAAAPKRIELSSNGKVEFVDASDIVRFSGAGDYVEVFLTDGRSALYSASLAALARELSFGFVRVHRSHIVNAALVKSLTRDSSGTGNLEMSDGSAVPVSRRNMANVREALSTE